LHDDEARKTPAQPLAGADGPIFADHLASAGECGRRRGDGEGDRQGIIGCLGSAAKRPGLEPPLRSAAK
jgi:hypothetical protein